MDVTRGGLLACSATAALAAAEFGLCSIEADGGDGGGGGGAADLLDDGGPPAGDPPAGDPPAAADPPAGDPPAGDPAATGDAPEWIKSFSADKGDGGELSNQEYLLKSGVKDLDGLVKRFRDTERAFREGGKVKVPGENATDAEKQAFREAIGVPATVEGYETALPDGLDPAKYELDGTFLDPLKTVALEHNITGPAWKAISEAFMRQQAQNAADEAQRHNSEKADTLRDWGAVAEQRQEEFRRGAQLLGLNRSDVMAMQSGLGARKTLETLAKLGGMAGEDVLTGTGGGGAQRFGVSSSADAQKQLDAMIGDPETATKIRSKDPVTVDRYNRLTEAKAYWRELEDKRGK